MTPAPLDNPLLAEHAAEIRRLGKRVKEDVIDIGRHLTEAKEIIKKTVGHGHWLPWLEREFEWSVSTAENYINVFKLRGKFPTVGNLPVDMRSLYLLAAPSTPKEVVEEIVERAEAGEAMSAEGIKGAIKETREQQAKKPRTSRAMKLAIRSETLGAMFPRIERTSLERSSEMAALIELRRDSPKEAEELVKRAEAGEQVSAIAAVAAKKKNAHDRDDIGENSEAETKRKLARLAELERECPRLQSALASRDRDLANMREEKRRQEIEAFGLRGEIEDAKAAAAASLPDAALPDLAIAIETLIKWATQFGVWGNILPTETSFASADLKAVMKRLRELDDDMIRRRKAAKAAPAAAEQAHAGRTAS
jgi:hypothetical protein